MAIAGDNQSAVLWNLSNGEKLYDLSHTDEVWIVKFIKDDQILHTGSKDGLLHAFDITTGKEKHKLKFDGSIIAIRHEPVSGALAVGIRKTKHNQLWTDLRLFSNRTGAKVTRNK